MKKPFLAVILAIILILPLHAQISMEELSGVGPVEFINYEGPYIRIDTLSQIRDIGFSLGLNIRGGMERSGAANRYFVITSRSEPDGLKLDADIFGLGVDAAVDHIRNLRVIIQGYLEATYDYNQTDAALLAHYITVYNAVYRGSMGFFETRYRRAVLSHLTQGSAGLSIRFDEWPGQTLMLIPIGLGLGGPLSAIDTGSLLDDAIREQMRQEPDGGIDVRREMVDLLEREAADAAQIAEDLRRAAQAEEARIAQERAEAAFREQQAQEQLDQALRDMQNLAQDRITGEGDDEREAEIQRQLEEAQQERLEALRRQEELDREQAILQAMREEAERQEAFAQQRLDDARDERQEITADQQAMIDAQRTPEAQTVLGISLMGANTHLGRLVRLDTATGREVIRSPISTINVRSVVQIANRIFAIAGENTGNSAVRIIEINPQNLEMVNQGDDDIAESSLLWLDGQDLFAIISSGGQLYLARFNTQLVLQARSTIEVHPSSSVFITGNHIVGQRADGSALLLNRGNLTEVR